MSESDLGLGRARTITAVPPGFNGVYAPKGLPPYIREGLERACANAVQSDALKRTIADTGQTMRYLTGAQFHARTAADHAFKGELLHRLGLGGQSSCGPLCHPAAVVGWCFPGDFAKRGRK